MKDSHESMMKLCPKCKTENPMVSNFCRHCRYQFPEASKNGQSLKPIIKYFRIRETDYVIGSTIHIEWDADNYTQIELVGKDVTLYKELVLNIERPQELFLIVKNDYDQAQATLLIAPTEAPIIKRFISSHYNILKGRKIKLSWNVENAIKLILRCSSGETDVTAWNKIELSPLVSDTYTLIGIAKDHRVTIEKSVIVSVKKEVVINHFLPNISLTLETMPIVLCWSVENADQIVLYPNNINVTNQNSIQLYPDRTTIYRLLASNVLSVQERIVTVSVQSLPKMNVKLLESISQLHIPNCTIDFSPICGSINNTAIDKWMMSPAKQSITKKIEKNSIFEKLRSFIKLKRE